MSKKAEKRRKDATSFVPKSAENSFLVFLDLFIFLRPESKKIRKLRNKRSLKVKLCHQSEIPIDVYTKSYLLTVIVIANTDKKLLLGIISPT